MRLAAFSKLIPLLDGYRKICEDSQWAWPSCTISFSYHQEKHPITVNNSQSRAPSSPGYPFQNKADLIELLHNVQGTYTELLGAVSKKLTRRKGSSSHLRIILLKFSVERPLIVLLFTEKNVPQKLTDSWKEMKNSTLHIFRVGAAKNKYAEPYPWE